MGLQRQAMGVFPIFLAAAVLTGCESSPSESHPQASISRPLLAACTQLDRQPAEMAPSGGFAHIYDLPPSLAIALDHSGNAALQRLGRQLVVPGSNPTIMRTIPKAFDQGQSLCHALIR